MPLGKAGLEAPHSPMICRAAELNSKHLAAAQTIPGPQPPQVPGSCTQSQLLGTQSPSRHSSSATNGLTVVDWSPCSTLEQNGHPKKKHDVEHHPTAFKTTASQPSGSSGTSASTYLPSSSTPLAPVACHAALFKDLQTEQAILFMAVPPSC